MDNFASAFADAEAHWDAIAAKDPSVEKKVSHGGVADAFAEMFGNGPAAKTPLIKDFVEKGQTSLRELLGASYGDDESIIKGFHPSFISGSACPVAYYFNATTDRPPLHAPPRVYRIFDNGSDVHSRIQRYLSPWLRGTWRCRKCQATHNQNTEYVRYLENALKTEHNRGYQDELKEIVSHSEFPTAAPKECLGCKRKQSEEYNPLFVYKEWRIFSRRYGIVGKTDGLFDWKNKLLPIEIKSANTRTCKALPRVKPSPKYVKQFNFYMGALKEVFGDLIADVGLFIYEDKDNQDLYEFEHWYSPEITAKEYELCEQVMPVRDIKELTPARGDECTQCPYFGPCHKTFGG